MVVVDVVVDVDVVADDCNDDCDCDCDCDCDVVIIVEVRLDKGEFKALGINKTTRNSSATGPATQFLRIRCRRRLHEP